MTLHQTVLTVLEPIGLSDIRKAGHTRELEEERLLNEVIDETGTVPCASEGGDKMS